MSVNEKSAEPDELNLSTINDRSIGVKSICSASSFMSIESNACRISVNLFYQKFFLILRMCENST
jgi:hypothetical protein